ncbi:MAG: hypothetical protein QOE13_1411 [Gaiellaceae bacterium]|nr:hypothetical protein [Gaiellaceae bacterium]
MRSFKVLGPLALALGLITAAPAAAGGDAGPPLYPSIVNVRLVRTEAALDRAVEFVDTAQIDKAVAQLAIARSQMRKAWTGEKYVIDTAPPPVAAEGSVGRVAGGAVAGASPYADQYTTALGVLGLQHDVASVAIALSDGANAALLAGLSTTIFAALNDRDTAIAYIHSKDIPAAPAGIARASGGAIAGTWGTIMPQATPILDDEIQQIEGTLKAGVSTGAARVLRAADLQDIKTERNINQLWPPVPAG